MVRNVVPYCKHTQSIKMSALECPVFNGSILKRSSVSSIREVSVLFPPARRAEAVSGGLATSLRLQTV